MLQFLLFEYSGISNYGFLPLDGGGLVGVKKASHPSLVPPIVHLSAHDDVKGGMVSI